MNELGVSTHSSHLHPRARHASGVCAAVAAIVLIAACGGASSRGAVTTTSAPATTATANTTAATTPAVAPAGAAATTTSPLAAEIAAGARDLPSAVYDPSVATTAVDAMAVPMSLTIPALKVLDAPVEPVGVTDAGELDVPGPKLVGWYRYSSTPGAVGSTVLAGHVDYDGVLGIFRYLTKLSAGDEVSVTTADGRPRRYVVTERTMYDKDKLPPDRVWSRTGEPMLVLLTCGGTFDNRRRSFEQNVVVYARPA